MKGTYRTPLVFHTIDTVSKQLQQLSNPHTLFGFNYPRLVELLTYLLPENCGPVRQKPHLYSCYTPRS